MGNKPNAAQIAKGLAALGGGSKKEGGGGMMAGIENIFGAGVQYGQQLQLGAEASPLQIGSSFLDEDDIPQVD